MATAPANNFERHMLPVAFVFGFVCLTFWRESKAAKAPGRSLPAAGTGSDGTAAGSAEGLD